MTFADRVLCSSPYSKKHFTLSSCMLRKIFSSRSLQITSAFFLVCKTISFPKKGAAEINQERKARKYCKRIYQKSNTFYINITHYYTFLNASPVPKSYMPIAKQSKKVFFTK